MTCDEAAEAVLKALNKARESQWGTVRTELELLYKRMTETPADIHNNYRSDYFEGKIK